MTSLLEATNLLFGYEGQGSTGKVSTGILKSELDFSLQPGDVVALMGENGCGKSTLLKTFAGILPPCKGTVSVCGKNLYGKTVSTLNARDRAKMVALVRMGLAAPERMTVREFVGLGRLPYSGLLDGRSPEDERVIDESMDLLDVTAFERRLVTELSDGERSRVYLAEAVAQQVKVLLLDEPNAFLDAPRSNALFRLLNRLAGEREMGIVVSTHSVDYAERYSNRMIIIEGGGIQVVPTSEARARGLLAWTER